MSNSLKKSPHTLETEDLLNLLEQKEDDENNSEPVVIVDDVLNFIGTFSLEPGTEKIKKHTLYLIYKVWSKAPLKKVEFLTKISSYFENTKISNSAAFLINQGSIKLTHAAYKYYSNERTKINSKPWVKHFETFLKFHSLSKGDYWINYKILYFIYDKYCHATGLDKAGNTHLGELNFRHYCKLYLPHKLTKHGEMVAVSDNIKQFFQIDQLARMEKAYAEEEKEPPKRRKTSKSKRKIKLKNSS